MHIMDVRSGKWERMNPQGEPPSPRAAHAAAAVGSMVVIQVRHLHLSHRRMLHLAESLQAGQLSLSVISADVHLRLKACKGHHGEHDFTLHSQGGIGPAGLASEDLHVLDFTDFERPRWHR